MKCYKLNTTIIHTKMTNNDNNDEKTGYETGVFL